jgi:hypothetical protein
MLGAPAKAQYGFTLFQSTDTCKAEFSLQIKKFGTLEEWDMAGQPTPTQRDCPIQMIRDLSGEMKGLSNTLPYAGVPNCFRIACLGLSKILRVCRESGEVERVRCCQSVVGGLGPIQRLGSAFARAMHTLIAPSRSATERNTPPYSCRTLSPTAAASIDRILAGGRRLRPATAWYSSPNMWCRACGCCWWWRGAAVLPRACPTTVLS